jgi:hypothetical protein
VIDLGTVSPAVRLIYIFFMFMTAYPTQVSVKMSKDSEATEKVLKERRKQFTHTL